MPTVVEALESFYEQRANAGHDFIPLFRECERLTGLPPPLAFFLTTHLFEIEFQLYTFRLAGENRLPHAGRFALRFDDGDNALWN